MFNPSRDQARQFFTMAWKKQLTGNGEALTPLERIAADIAALHPEYHAILEDPDSVSRDFAPEDGNVNPFLHLSLHLAIEEQLSIDQPPGIRAAFARCQLRHGNRHDALHDALECLGETIFNAQRNQSQPDALAYLNCLTKRAGGQTGANAQKASGTE